TLLLRLQAVCNAQAHQYCHHAVYQSFTGQLLHIHLNRLAPKKSHMRPLMRKKKKPAIPTRLNHNLPLSFITAI
ncbi:MAG TPA: hypothetical protein PKZ51_10005, partial [Saprospiraceae bacterium]|nr:hypothetical protein [Saprospiraceae bacterium]